MARPLFNWMVTAVTNHDPYFHNNIDCTRREGISSLIKCTSAIRQLAYDVNAIFLDEYMQISERSSRMALDHFCEAVMETHGQYVRRNHGSNPFIFLEAVAAQDLWIWHAFFSVVGSNNDINKVVEDVGEDSDFNGGAWVSATNYVVAFGGTVTGCLGDIDNFLKKKKLKQVVAIVKSCYPNALGDLNVLTDVSGTIPGTIHYKVIDVGSYENDITPRQNYYGCKIFLWKEERAGLLINSPRGSSSTTTFSQATSTSPSLSPTPSTTPIYYGGSSTNT
nr:hypothetical protein [Tanacetum cinerariifolium]